MSNKQRLTQDELDELVISINVAVAAMFLTEEPGHGVKLSMLCAPIIGDHADIYDIERCRKRIVEGCDELLTLCSTRADVVKFVDFHIDRIGLLAFKALGFGDLHAKLKKSGLSAYDAAVNVRPI
jgi:hypothetical protein